MAFSTRAQATETAVLASVSTLSPTSLWSHLTEAWGCLGKASFLLGCGLSQASPLEDADLDSSIQAMETFVPPLRPGGLVLEAKVRDSSPSSAGLTLWFGLGSCASVSHLKVS